MRKFTLVLFLLSFTLLFAQKEISGKVTDNSGSGLSGVNIKAKGTTTGTSTDFDGSYKIKVDENATLVFSSVGFEKVEKSASEGSVINVTMVEDGGSKLDDVVVVGTRTAPRSNTTSALPVDVLSSRDLLSTGQPTFDKALQYKIPSFNTVQTPVNDATSLLDPYEIRNLGPSRTLVLINGKRKNMSALLYTQTSPGRGETGADISAIPTDAIERVEVLRDGASAQYGSDAIAGVMNIILKKNTGFGSTTVRTGVTSAGDGEMLGISLNNGSTVGEKGFVNYTVDFSRSNLANRPGTVDGGTKNIGPNGEPLSGGEYADFVFTDPTSVSNYIVKDQTTGVKTLGGTVLTGLSDSQIGALFTTYQSTADYTTNFNAIKQGNTDGRDQIDKFLAKKPDAGNINGSPETTAAKFEVNGGFDYSESTQLYYNAAYVYKKVNSFANYRTPYWRSLGSFPWLNNLYGNGDAANPSYDGYVPTFVGDLKDYNATLGYKSKMNGWNTDVSMTIGGNEQLYSVNNSQNRSTEDVDGNPFNDETPIYGAGTPVSFKPGGTSFNHVVGNLDISKAISDKVSIGFGSEFRTEDFEIIAGDSASYIGGGADSFQGNTPDNSGKFNRYNLGAYFDVAYDVNKDFLINGTARYENYSDFGDATVWKISSRYKFLDDKVTLRGSISTGFRAPSLHQIYTQKSQSAFVPGQGIVVSGLINNVSSSAKTNGIDKLDAEKSTNFTVGVGLKPIKNLSITIDYYDIRVDDRIVLGNLVDFGKEDGIVGNDPNIKVGTGNKQSFFSNAIDTKTSGLDFVASYKGLGIGSGKMNFNLSGNFTYRNERVGDVRNPNALDRIKSTVNPELEGQSVLNGTQEALLFTSRPKYKYILGVDYEIGKFGLSLNNTVFGPTQFRNDGMSTDIRIVFLQKVVTDLGINFNANKKLTFALNVNNLLNVLPEWQFASNNAAGKALLADANAVKGQTNLITFNGRYSQMTYDGYHFSQLGTMLNLSMNYKF